MIHCQFFGLLYKLHADPKWQSVSHPFLTPVDSSHTSPQGQGATQPNCEVDLRGNSKETEEGDDSTKIPAGSQVYPDCPLLPHSQAGG